MRKTIKILTISIFTSLNLFGQNKLPKNLIQTVKFLNIDCSENIKNNIKNIHNDSLIYSVYPFAKTEPNKSYKLTVKFHNIVDES